jgi:hypothetical protein
MMRFHSIKFSFEWVCLFFLEWDLVKILSMSLWTKNQRLSSVCAQSRAMTANISGQTSCKIQLASDTCPNRCMTFVQVWLDCMSCFAPALSTDVIITCSTEWSEKSTESRVECQPNLLKMGWKSSLAIHLGFWFYLVGGGAIYFYIEDPYYHLPAPPKRNVTQLFQMFWPTFTNICVWRICRCDDMAI